MASPQATLEAAFADHQRGHRGRAEKQYRNLLRRQPDNPDALYLLGMLYLEQDKADAAAQRLERAVGAAAAAGRRIDPGWRLALGTARQRLGDHAGALDAFEPALRDDPQSVDALFCRATALQELERLDDAARAYEAVLTRAPRHAEAANNLGAVHRAAGRPGEALRAFRAAVAARPDYVDALDNLGVALSDAGFPAEAVAPLKKVLDARPDDSVAEAVYFDCLLRAGNLDAAEDDARSRLKMRPDEPALIAILGNVAQFRGDSAAATAAYGKAIALDAACTRAQIGLAELGDAADRDIRIAELEALLGNDEIRELERAVLHMALARHIEATGRSEAAFDSYLAGNAMKHEVLKARGQSYDRDTTRARVDALCDTVTAGSLAGGGINDSDVPVFIVGMPRSGTTLTEQILASHPAVFGAGELTYLDQIAGELEHRFGYPRSPGPAEILAKAADSYLAALDRLSGGATLVTDKLPGNFLHLGLIARLFPNARIVHCRRDSMDTGLSCFTRNFAAAGLSWSYDLAEIGHYACQYHRIMDHWREVLPPGRMLEIDYEDTVSDLEGQARRLVEFAGLDWDAACLCFHETERVVTTASVSQVRRRVYSTSVGRWRRYGDGVLPLARALDACGRGPDMGEKSR